MLFKISLNSPVQNHMAQSANWLQSGTLPSLGDERSPWICSCRRKHSQRHFRIWRSSAPLGRLQCWTFVLLVASRSSVQKPCWLVVTAGVGCVYYHVLPKPTQYAQNDNQPLWEFLSTNQQKHPEWSGPGTARLLWMLILRRSGRGMRNWPSITNSLPQVASEDGDRYR